MPQYSNSYSLQDGGTVNAVFNTESNTITYTVTSPGGQTATLTLPPDANPQSVPNVNNIRGQIRNQGGSALTIAGFGQGLQAVQFNTKEEASKAETAATSTNTSTPENPSPPPPTSNTTDPAVPPPTPAPSTVTPTEATPPPVAPADDPFEQSRAEAAQRLDNQAPTEQDVIDAETDPFEKSRLEAAQQASSEAPTAQDVIDTEEDPVERARQEAAQRSTDEVPVPQVEIDPNEDPFEASRVEAEQKLNRQELQRAEDPTRGTTAVQTALKTEATQQDQVNFAQFEDWRVRLSLVPQTQQAKYLYNADDPGILQPLQATNGILFPYTPNIQVSYAANYDSSDITHSNYKIFQYRNSSVDNITITCDFTAQDTFEANYLLAVIHFLRSVTKMFYGKDLNPLAGTPPPLCYVTGLGSFQFDAHPLAITQFSYNLPTDVDYIRAGTSTTLAGVNKAQQNSPNNGTVGTSNRLQGAAPGGVKPPPKFKGTPGGTIEPTYVPTKMQITIQAIPIVSRNDISNNFSLKDYATGALLRGQKGNKRISGGIW